MPGPASYRDASWRGVLCPDADGGIRLSLLVGGQVQRFRLAAADFNALVASVADMRHQRTCVLEAEGG